jgi:uncharacterized membrane protein YeaQ/YmgE (transglycosylase-associated protein family)
MTIGRILVWLITGALAGTLAGRLVTFSKLGLGFWTNLFIGMAGALVGGVLFWLFRIDLGLGEIKITGEDLVSAFVGSLLCVGAWKLIQKRRGGQKPEPKAPAK